MDPLLNLAEIALIFVGFVAVFIAVTSEAGDMSFVESLYLRTIVVESIVSAFIALVPVSIVLIGVNGPTLWYIAGGLGLTLSIAGGAILVPDSLAALRATSGLIDHFFIAAGWMLAILGIGVILLNTGGWLWTPGLGPHFFAVVLFLAIAALAFLVIVFRRLRADAG
ncbi:MAG: hypothetical protein HRT77_14175 [Halioglobus sp.]|nr:hypothetical protein [Halioglobus sp.]